MNASLLLKTLAILWIVFGIGSSLDILDTQFLTHINTTIKSSTESLYKPPYKDCHD